MIHFLKKRRRKKWRAEPFPSAWLEYIERNFPLYRRLTASDQEELLGHIRVFLKEKHFEGCGGLEMTDEIRVTIAAQACLLLLHRDTNYYPRVTSILVYPSAYIARSFDRTADGVVSEFDDIRLGEAWSHGTVVLSWDDVKHGAADIRDGRNLVLHEFAHQLDGESGSVRGSPVLEQRSMYVAWARVLGQAYERLRRDVMRGRRTVLDRYGATNEAEFFAVVTEAFFERPRELERTHPALYEQLKSFYRQDPVSYVD